MQQNQEIVSISHTVVILMKINNNWRAPSTLRIVADITELSDATGIPNFSHFKVHAPCEITDERYKNEPNRCSAAVRHLLRSVPETATGFIIMADWIKYYKSISIESAPRRYIDSIYIFETVANTDPLICERDLLRALTSQWAKSTELQLRLTESCLQTAGSNACAAIVGSEDDLATLIMEGLNVLNSADTQHDDRAYQMLQIPLSKILENDEDNVRSIAQSKMTENRHEGGVPIPKMCHHLKVFLSKKELWSPPLIDHCRTLSIQTDQLCLLLLVQHLSTGIDFDLPGGTRRLGETSMATLLRKLREESGLKLRNLAITNHSDGDMKQSTLQRIKLEDTFDCYVTRLYT